MKKTLHKLALLFLLIVGVVNSMYATNEKYAVIISGSNSDRYRNDCYVVYRTLLGKGYQGNIYVAMPNGNGYGNNQYNSTLDDIQHIFEELSQAMTGDDDLFIYVTGSGKRNATTGHSYIKLLGEDSISDAAFTHMLEALQYRTINIVMQQDYAGGFIDDLIGLNNIVITTACNATEIARIRAPYNYFDEFTYRWVSAITGISPYRMITSHLCDAPVDLNHPNPNIWECYIPDDGDYNGDGFVTMEEAFNYAEFYDRENEHPQIASNPGCLSRALALNELLYPDDCSPVLIEGWDLYMKDNGLDIGEEPNTTTTESWISNAIWCEQNGQIVDVLQSGETYDVCVRIGNRGNIASPDSAELFAHWTKATIGNTWPWGWYGENTYDCNGTTVPRGGLIGSVYLPSIGPGETDTVKISWTTPEVETYMPCLNFAEDLAQLWHYCLLARIVDEQEQPDETITDMELREFVLDFNNVISRNVTIMSVQTDGLSDPQLTGVVALTNPIEGENSGPYTLKCQIEGPEDWDHLAAVRLTFAPSFYNAQIFMTGHNCYHTNSTGSFELTEGAYFDEIYFVDSDDSLYPLVLEVIYYDTYDPGDYPRFRIYLSLEDTGGQVVGGEDFYFYGDQQSTPNNIIRRDRFDENIEKEIVHKPVEPDEILYVDVYNAQGQLLMRTTNENVESLNLPQGVYILRKVGETQSYSIKIIK